MSQGRHHEESAFTVQVRFVDEATERRESEGRVKGEKGRGKEGREKRETREREKYVKCSGIVQIRVEAKNVHIGIVRPRCLTASIIEAICGCI